MFLLNVRIISGLAVGHVDMLCMYCFCAEVSGEDSSFVCGAYLEKCPRSVTGLNDPGVSQGGPRGPQGPLNHHASKVGWPETPVSHTNTPHSRRSAVLCAR